MKERFDNGFLIKNLHDRLEKQANNDLRSSGLTMMQVSVLIELQKAEGKQLTMKELERHFLVAQSTVAGIVSRLEQKGLVEALSTISDKRIKMVHLTPEGEACCFEASGYMKRTEEQLLVGFTPEEKIIFSTLLAKAANNIK